jgi:hypothetical protein
MKIRTSTLLQWLICGWLVLLTADLQAQLLFKTKFASGEGYSNGWLMGQPSTGNPTTGNVWSNINAFFLPVDGPATNAGNCNNGHSWTNQDGTPWYIMTITNCTSAGGELMIASDNNIGTNTKTYFVKMGFPTIRRGPVTLSWDWQFVPTNTIPADYDAITNNYMGSLQGYDHGFCLADYENRWLSYPPVSRNDPNWTYGCNSTPVRLGTRQDCRYAGPNSCNNSGEWNNWGPQFKDGKLLHMTTVAYLTNAPDGEYGEVRMNTYDNFCQRDGEAIWQTAFWTNAFVVDPYNSWNPPEITNYVSIAASGFRRCPGTFDPESGMNCITFWMNGSQVKPGHTDDKNPDSYYWAHVIIRNIRVVGPDPVPTPTLSIGGNPLQVTFNGYWLEGADSLAGPWEVVAVQSQSPYNVPGGGAKKFYRASN